MKLTQEQQAEMVIRSTSFQAANQPVRARRNELMAQLQSSSAAVERSGQMAGLNPEVQRRIEHVLAAVLWKPYWTTDVLMVHLSRASCFWEHMLISWLEAAMATAVLHWLTAGTNSWPLCWHLKDLWAMLARGWHLLGVGPKGWLES